MSKFLLILLILFAGVTIAGGIYKWVDEQGRTIYLDAPPPGKAAQRVDLPPQPPKEEIERAQQELEKQQEEVKQRVKARQEQLDEDIKQRQRASELDEIQRGPSTPIPGGTGALPALQRDVWRLMITMDSAVDPACTNHKVINTEWIETNRETRTAVERWTLDRCGEAVRYRVTFVPAPQGGTNFTLQRE